MIGNLKKYILPNLPYVVILVILTYFVRDLPWLPVPPMIASFGVTLLLRIYIWQRTNHAKKFRREAEYGTARWGA